MATIVLTALGAAAGASIGGGVLGLSSVVIGRAVGAIAGRMVDGALFGEGSEPVEQGRVERFRVVGASEGAPVARVYGRMRLGGQVIWSSGITEHLVTEEGAGGSGKGLFSTQSASTQTYRYMISMAVAVSEGVISHVGRVWADGQEIAPDALNMRVYTGTEDQMPDPLIEAVKGAGAAPAYRGTAYVVIEALDLTSFGNRVPVLNFEVFRPEQPDQPVEVARGTRAVAIIPGTGEYALATTTVHSGALPGEATPVNENTPLGKADFAASLEALEGELPNLEAASLVVSWFGNDLRCGSCEVAPKVEQYDREGQEMPWTVSGLSRADAGQVPLDGDRPVYGGTPTDQSVVEAIAALHEAGKAVTFYPFILMTQMAGNALPDPWTGADDQPALPWRGRITLSVAPGQAGSPDGTAAAAAEVDAFFGAAQSGDFTVVDGAVTYTGGGEWSYRRFILHYAHLCAAAGGVESFLIGSELRSLTQIRGEAHAFPVVAQLIQLAADVRAILGAGTKISYAADWSEYFGYHPADGSGDLYFHLDPLWSDANIDFIGIDNYMPLSDWREGFEHKDAEYGSIYNLDYLKSNILGGEGYDWYYHAPEAEAIQLRSAITDGAYDEPWVWRYKDVKSWWQNPHHERFGGLREMTATAWVPGSKPIWFTELGCAAIDKGSNQPNKFVDPKSSESSLPKYSTGQRDDFMQMQYLRAIYEFWADPANNPTDPTSGVQMLDMSRAHVWAWDARPFPWFPARGDVWADGDNYARGHWLNGRSSNRSLASVVREICRASGLAADALDVSRLYGLVRGFNIGQVTGARNALQPLMLTHAIEAAEREGRLHVFSRTGLADRGLDPDALAMTDELAGSIELTRAPEVEVAGRVRLSFVESGGDYDIRATEAVFADEETHSVSTSEVPLVLLASEGRAIAERWLAEARVARDRAAFALPPSGLGNMAGDVVEIDLPGGPGTFRIDHVEQAGIQMVKAVRVEPRIYIPSDSADEIAVPRAFQPAVPVLPIFMDLPMLSGTEVPHAPHLAVTARPWPGTVAVFSAPEDNGYTLNRLVGAPARVGVTETALAAARAGLIDRGPALRVRLTSGTLASATLDSVLNGANAAAIGDGSTENWEVFQFSRAELVADGVYELSGRLRGQVGTDALAPAAWPAGSIVVFLDNTVGQIALAASARGLERHFQVGPATRPLGDATYRHQVHAFNGIGLRPYAPVHLAAKWQGGDLGLNWIRRTRIDGDSWAATEVPLGEDSERYVVRVVSGATLLREATVTTPAWTYSAAMQAADGASAPFDIEVAQLSQSFGPGPARRLTVAA